MFGRGKLASCCCSWENKNTLVAFQAWICAPPNDAVQGQVHGFAVRRALLLLLSELFRPQIPVQQQQKAGGAATHTGGDHGHGIYICSPGPHWDQHVRSTPPLSM